MDSLFAVELVELRSCPYGAPEQDQHLRQKGLENPLEGPRRCPSVRRLVLHLGGGFPLADLIPT